MSKKKEVQEHRSPNHFPALGLNESYDLEPNNEAINIT